MEGDDQTLAGTDIEQGQGTATISQGRSYECSFCKRGFSNAQALGGHMNIHRKDKAKLKQTPNEAKPAQDKSNLNWPWNASSRDQTHLVDIKQLPLLAETPYNSCSCEPQNPTDHHQLLIHHGESTEKALSSTHDSSTDLDLELRLGPEPQDPSPATSMGTRKFF